MACTLALAPAPQAPQLLSSRPAAAQPAHNDGRVNGQPGHVTGDLCEHRLQVVATRIPDRGSAERGHAVAPVGHTDAPSKTSATPSDLVPISETTRTARVCKQGTPKGDRGGTERKGADAAGGPVHEGMLRALRGSRARGRTVRWRHARSRHGHVADVLIEAASMTEVVGYLGVTLAG
jgi:hypothetical protein